MYVFFQLFNESPGGFEFFAVIHLNFKSSKEVFHYAVVRAVRERYATCDRSDLSQKP